MIVIVRDREDEGIAKRDRPPPEMRSRFKKRVWIMFEHPDSSLFSKLLALISCAFVLISVRRTLARCASALLCSASSDSRREQLY